MLFGCVESLSAISTIAKNKAIWVYSLSTVRSSSSSNGQRGSFIRSLLGSSREMGNDYTTQKSQTIWKRDERWRGF